MSSSVRVGQPANAVLRSSDRRDSPVLLPEVSPDDFVAEFNREYRRLGWQIEASREGAEPRDRRQP